MNALLCPKPYAKARLLRKRTTCSSTAIFIHSTFTSIATTANAMKLLYLWTSRILAESGDDKTWLSCHKLSWIFHSCFQKIRSTVYLTASLFIKCCSVVLAAKYPCINCFNASKSGCDAFYSSAICLSPHFINFLLRTPRFYYLRRNL